MHKAVLFDADGTLLDAWDFVFGAVRHSLSKHGIKYPEDTVIKRVMGKPIVQFYQALSPSTDPLTLVEDHKAFQNESHNLIKLFPEIKETLKKLKDKGYLIGIVSNRLRKSLLESLKQAEILQFIDVVVGADDVSNPKPHKDHILEALKILKVSPKDALMVGDTEHDILAGQNAGVKTVGVTYGWMGKDIKKYKPDFAIDNIKDLLQILK